MRELTFKLLQNIPTYHWECFLSFDNLVENAGVWIKEAPLY